MDEQTRLDIAVLDTLIESTVAALEAARALRLAIERREHPSLPGFTPVKPVVDPIYFDNIDSDIRPVRSVTLGPDAA